MFLSWEMTGGGGRGARIIRQTADQNLVVAFFRKKVLHETKQSAIKDVYYVPSNL